MCDVETWNLFSSEGETCCSAAYSQTIRHQWLLQILVLNDDFRVEVTEFKRTESRGITSQLQLQPRDQFRFLSVSQSSMWHIDYISCHYLFFNRNNTHRRPQGETRNTFKRFKKKKKRFHLNKPPFMRRSALLMLQLSRIDLWVFSADSESDLSLCPGVFPEVTFKTRPLTIHFLSEGMWNETLRLEDRGALESYEMTDPEWKSSVFGDSPAS